MKGKSRQDRLGLRSSRGATNWNVNNVSKSSHFTKGLKANFMYSPKQEPGFQKLITNMNKQKTRNWRPKKQDIGKMANMRRSYDSRNNRVEAPTGSFNEG